MACNLVDDEPPVPGATDTDGQAGEAACLEVAAEIQAQCMPPQQFIALWEEGDSTMILVDDPAAAVGIGPNGWLVQVSSSADFIGSYQFDGDTCTIGCGWCQPGESFCYAGFDDEGLPECGLCLPADTADPGAQCAQHLEVCIGPDGGGLDETGGDEGLDSSDDGSLDETGGDGVLEEFEESAGLFDYDCSQWDPAGSVTVDIRGNATIDAVLVEDLALYYGDPLADCDGTSFRQQSDGYFAVGEMSTTGLLAQLGLLPGDTIVAINGEAMDNLDTIAGTAVDLFLGSGVTSSFSLTIGRGRTRLERVIRVR